MKLKTLVTIVTLTAFSILLTESITYPCEEEDSTPAQTLKTIRDDQSCLVFEVASNYRAVPQSQTEGGVWKEIYIMEPILRNNQALLNQIYQSIRWKSP